MVTCQECSLAHIRDSAIPLPEWENLRFQELHEHTAKDLVYQTLQQHVKEGFPNQCPSLWEVFWGLKTNWPLMMNSISYGCRLFIPNNLHPTMPSHVHDAHQGISQSKAWAHLTINWPGIDQDIEDFVDGCHHCQHHLPSNTKELMISKPILEQPF